LSNYCQKKKAFPSNPNDDNPMNPSIEMAYGKRKKSSLSLSKWI
jgi:hypothetical protein